MTRTTITKTADNEVTLTAIDPWADEPITRVFWIPTSGGYVREGDRHIADDRQVCNGLDRKGSTLMADDGDELLSIIRTEWKVCRREAMKDHVA